MTTPIVPLVDAQGNSMNATFLGAGMLVAANLASTDGKGGLTLLETSTWDQVKTTLDDPTMVVTLVAATETATAGTVDEDITAASDTAVLTPTVAAAAPAIAPAAVTTPIAATSSDDV